MQGQREKAASGKLGGGGGGGGEWRWLWEVGLEGKGGGELSRHRVQRWKAMQEQREKNGEGKG